jgi:hypothetical protein
MIEMRKNVEPGETPAVISVSMIDQDLKNGVSKSDMAIKYNIKPWEVERMFEHADLKGRRPSKRKPLSFEFVDDTIKDTSEPQFSEREKQVEVDPNQVTLEQAIDEAIVDGFNEDLTDEEIQMEKDVKNGLYGETTNFIEDTLKAAVDTPEITGIPNGDTMSDTDDDELEIPTLENTMELVKEQELEMEDESFEL